MPAPAVSITAARADSTQPPPLPRWVTTPPLTGLAAKKAVIRWAWDLGLHIYQARPGRKHPFKVRVADDPEAGPREIFESWSGRDDKVLLVRIPPGMLIADADTTEAVDFLLTRWPAIPDHMWLRSVNGTEKHVFSVARTLGRRSIRPRDGLDVLANPEGKIMWCKIWGDGYEMYPGPLPQAPPFLTTLLRRDPPPRRRPPPPPAGSALGNRYAEHVLKTQLTEVLAAVPGRRDVTLNKAAYVTGRLVGEGLAAEDRVRGLLAAAGEDTGLPACEVWATVRSGLSAGIRAVEAGR